ncbi:DUF4424 domain-containing protein [Pelagibacterium limicola]|uniref:DUF4424 domain-containing protein n=1 Tax=Pelagibacterium limicola TaxID=2791022 RepID=UPI0018AF7653|nr:DUF4424 domain-containing protein [Pelagibacterium limicola]
MRGFIAFSLIGALAVPVFANDSAAEVGAGGLVFVRNENIRMASEDLYLSMDEVRVVYRFENLTDEDQHVLVAFPMPDITGDFHSMVSYPTDDPENIFGFTTTFDGEPVEAQLYQYAFALGVDRSKDLQKRGIPLAPHSTETQAAIDALSEADRKGLIDLGLLSLLDFGWEETVVYSPVWTLKSAYTWEAVFPAGETVVVEHQYKPGIGGASWVGVLYDDTVMQARYTEKYCVEDPIKSAVRRSLQNPDEIWGAPYHEVWLSYVLSTGENWAGPIGEFRLIVDKGAPENLVSFCGNNVVKTGPTTFEMTQTDFYPWSDIHVLFLVRHDSD